MDKPFTLKVQELEQKLIGNINNSRLPAFCIKVVLQDIMMKIDEFDKEEIQNYNKNLEENEKQVMSDELSQN